MDLYINSRIAFITSIILKVNGVGYGCHGNCSRRSSIIKDEQKTVMRKTVMQRNSIDQCQVSYIYIYIYIYIYM